MMNAYKVITLVFNFIQFMYDLEIIEFLSKILKSKSVIFLSKPL